LRRWPRRWAEGGRGLGLGSEFWVLSSGIWLLGKRIARVSRQPRIGAIVTHKVTNPGGFPPFTAPANRVNAWDMPGPLPPRSAPHCTLALKVMPNASREEIVGWLGEALKVKVRAPALDGRANAALMEFLADRLGLPRRAVILLRGDRSRQKIVRVEGLGLETARERLGV
jgi:uncharacterized protein (TIGR00251 family)